MARINWTTPRVAALAGMSLLAGTALVSVAYAQTPPAPTKEQKAQEHLNRFATNLGVDATKVKEAMKTTALQYIDEALAAAKIDAAQAQAMRDRINSGQFGPGMSGMHGPGMGGPGMEGKHGPGAMGRGPGGPGMEGKRGPGGMGGAFGAAPEALATFLGVTPEALKTELNGKSLAAVASAHGKSADELKAFITSAAEQRANEAVAAGKLTQAQATAMVDMLKANLDTFINAVHQKPAFGPGGPGGPRGPRGGQGIPQGAPQGAPQGTVPSGT